MKKKVIILLGPTASGKTRKAVILAQLLEGEIISADSRQVFCGMDLGTGKDLVEYGKIIYHLIDIRNPTEEFSVSDFQRLSLKALGIITAKGKIPIICGGSGHYIKALIEDYEFGQPTNLEFTLCLETKPLEELYIQLKSLGLWEKRQWQRDSKRRIARAIEIKLAGETRHNNASSFQATYEPRIYYTSIETSQQRKLIAYRLDQRLEEGLVEEVKQLLKNEVPQERLERFGLEYKWVMYYLRGDLSYFAMRKKLITEICHLAKRQRTFIRYLIKKGHRLLPIEDNTSFSRDAKQWLKSDT